MLKPLAWMVLAGCVKSGSVTPLRVHDSGHLFVPLQMAGTSYEFIVDTGASFTVISPETQAALGIPADTGDRSTAAGADGQALDLAIVQLPVFTIAGQTLTDSRAAIMPMDPLSGPLQRPVAGVVGQNVLANFRVTLDLSAGSLALSDPRPSRPPRHSWEVPFDLFEVAPLLRVSVEGPDGERIPAVLDSGAGATILNHHAAEALGAVMDHNAATSQATGASATVLDLLPAHIPALQFAEARFGPQDVYVADLGIFHQLGVADGPAIILGIGLFNDHRLVIDYAAQTLWVSQP